MQLTNRTQSEINHMIERIEDTVPPSVERGALIMALEWANFIDTSTSLSLEDWLNEYTDTQVGVSQRQQPIPEPDITVDGVPLTNGQSMAVRVAITSYHNEMSGFGVLGEDSMGEAIRKGYKSRLDEVLGIMLSH